MNTVTLEAYAKINITLDILGKLPNGYHQLRSIMQSVSICDTLRIKKADDGCITLCCDDNAVPCDERNLVVKAARAFFAFHNMTCGVSFDLTKRIPSMAGMAGGSADCAAALFGLDFLFEKHTPREKLFELAVALGADVPFCLAGGANICEGVGERLTPLPDMPDCCIVIVKPEVSVSTPEAFRKYDSVLSPKKSDFDMAVSSYNSGNLNGICSSLFNALEYASECNEISDAKEKLLQNGANAALMTGSGSAVYGIFDNFEAAQKCKELLKNDYAFCALCKPMNCGVKVISNE